jgi:hypothetical protein
VGHDLPGPPSPHRVHRNLVTTRGSTAPWATSHPSTTNSRSTNTPAERRHNQPVRRTGATPFPVGRPRAGTAPAVSGSAAGSCLLETGDSTRGSTPQSLSSHSPLGDRDSTAQRTHPTRRSFSEWPWRWRRPAPPGTWWQMMATRSVPQRRSSAGISSHPSERCRRRAAAPSVTLIRATHHSSASTHIHETLGRAPTSGLGLQSIDP